MAESNEVEVSEADVRRYAEAAQEADDGAMPVEAYRHVVRAVLAAQVEDGRLLPAVTGGAAVTGGVVEASSGSAEPRIGGEGYTGWHSRHLRRSGGVTEGSEPMTAADGSVNLVLAFEDQDGREWLAAGVMAPLRRSGTDETCEVVDMPDRVFVLRSFKVVLP